MRKIILYAVIGASFAGGCAMTQNSTAYVTAGHILFGAALGAMASL